MNKLNIFIYILLGSDFIHQHNNRYKNIRIAYPEYDWGDPSLVVYTIKN